MVSEMPPTPASSPPEGPTETLPADQQLTDWLREARHGSSESLGQALTTLETYLRLVASKGLADISGKLGCSDVVQETFLEAHRDFAKFRGEDAGQFRMWLRRILVHNLLSQRRRFLDVSKRSVRREQSPGYKDGGKLDALACPGNSPSRAAVQNEDERRLGEALARLGDVYRQVIVLRNYERLTFAQIGARMQRSENAARMLWTRAFEKLSDELAECDVR